MWYDDSEKGWKVADEMKCCIAFISDDTTCAGGWAYYPKEVTMKLILPKLLYLQK